MNEALDFFGTQAEMARALGLDRASVAEWRTHGIPIGRQYQIELLTQGKLTADIPSDRREAKFIP